MKTHKITLGKLRELNNVRPNAYMELIYHKFKEKLGVDDVIELNFVNIGVIPDKTLQELTYVYAKSNKYDMQMLAEGDSALALRKVEELLND